MTKLKIDIPEGTTGMELQQLRLPELIKDYESLSITPNTFKERKFDFKDVDVYEDEFNFVKIDVTIKRFAINHLTYRYTAETEAAGGGASAASLKSGKSGKSKKSNKKELVEKIEKIEHEIIEKKVFSKAIEYLFENEDRNSVLVDVLRRDDEDPSKIFLKSGMCETHCVVLYKNPEVSEFNVTVIDPTNSNYSSHLSHINVYAKLLYNGSEDSKKTEDFLNENNIPFKKVFIDEKSNEILKILSGKGQVLPTLIVGDKKFTGLEYIKGNLVDIKSDIQSYFSNFLTIQEGKSGESESSSADSSSEGGAAGGGGGSPESSYRCASHEDYKISSLKIKCLSDIKLYIPADKNKTGPKESQERDCVDIAAKLAMLLQKFPPKTLLSETASAGGEEVTTRLAIESKDDFIKSEIYQYLANQNMKPLPSPDENPARLRQSSDPSIIKEVHDTKEKIAKLSDLYKVLEISELGMISKFHEVIGKPEELRTFHDKAKTELIEISSFAQSSMDKLLGESTDGLSASGGGGD